MNGRTAPPCFRPLPTAGLSCAVAPTDVAALHQELHQDVGPRLGAGRGRAWAPGTGWQRAWVWGTRQWQAGRGRAWTQGAAALLHYTTISHGKDKAYERISHAWFWGNRSVFRGNRAVFQKTKWFFIFFTSMNCLAYNTLNFWDLFWPKILKWA